MALLPELHGSLGRYYAFKDENVHDNLSKFKYFHSNHMS